MCSKTKDDDAVLLGLVQASKLLLQFGFRDVGARWMENVDDELAAREKSVGNEFASTQRNGCRVIRLKDLSEDSTPSGLLEEHPTLPRPRSTA